MPSALLLEILRVNIPLAPLATYCAVKVDRHGIDEAAFQAYERAQAEALAREAAEGRGERAVLLYEALRAAREG